MKDYPDVWLHVDAAWAGVTLACPEYRVTSRLEDINKYATSVGTNLHKVRAYTYISLLCWESTHEKFSGD